MRGVLIAFALLLAACGQDTSGTNQGAMQAWVGRNIADLQVQTLDGGKQRLKDVMVDKKPVVLNVWATWCSPCLKEMPMLDTLGKTGDYTVVAIATDHDANAVKAFLKKQSWGEGVKNIWFDSLGSVTREKLGAVGIPVTYVLDPSLTIKMVEAGDRDWAHPSMDAKMKKALAQ